MQLSLKAKILILTIVPMVLLSLTISWLYQQQAKDLSAQQVAIFEESLMSSRQESLIDNVDLAIRAITPILDEMDQGVERSSVEYRVKQTLRAMTYGDDGYFFAYNLSGINLVHPTQPELEGQDLYNLQDDNGQFVIRDLLGIARNGGGFYRYVWRKPTGDSEEDKLSYVIVIPQLNWMMGTGLYVDDIVRDVTQMREKVASNVRKSFWASSILLIATLSTVVLIVTLVNMHATQLADKRLKELANRYVTFQVIQRRNFARELHDGINQLLVSVKLRLNLADKQWGLEHGKDHLKKSVEQLNTAIQEVRRISHDLRPVALDDLGLETALHGMLDNLEEQTGISTRRRIRLPDQRLPDAVEITLYRVVQEAVTNATKHSNATQMTFNVSVSNSRILLLIGDNGRGLEAHASDQGIGLINMRERIELLGGRLKLQNRHRHPMKSRRGTLIQATLLLDPNSDSQENKSV